MRIDMHCHTAEGSLDAQVSIFTIVDVLKNKGFDGVLITDHNSYKGYEAWEESGRDDFVVLKGIEYDTRDAGHMLVILPQKTDTALFAMRGMSLLKLVKLVHRLGGIIGPAHPYAYCKFGMQNHAKWRRYRGLCYNFDFVESFNSCASSFSNKLAGKLAKHYRRPAFGGSDSHRFSGIGLGYTELSAEIRDNDDLLAALAAGVECKAWGHHNPDSFACAHSYIYSCSAFLYYYFGNSVASLFMDYKRRKARHLLPE